MENYEAPSITTIGSLHDMTLQVNKTLGANDGTGLIGIPGVPDGTPIGEPGSGPLS
ncbi:hypothetical protein SAMN05660662_2917 [Blastococcus aurantiacus]|uniref:Lasso RiPP family leader peptide-containing protein n=1 Tax=Blastococcus aurantiacus TaxID=1550231 RepID=A0A1G7MTV3_9ACTN|nr:hypothetical protein [Blastococcus aurantiacus]SDF65081.1 hypothetical protein SAMN05660662_2917 [Blastococcus aurantiacus]